MKVLFIFLVLLGCTKKVSEIDPSEIRISGDLVHRVDDKDYLIERKKLRAYDGAPPRIPHPVQPNIAYISCNNCHHVGSHHGPNNLHKDQENCYQCHVPITTDSLFKRNEYVGYFNYEKQDRAQPLGPPYIPHRVQDRQKCHICHTADGSQEALKPRHGHLENCTGCHVQRQMKVEAFSR